MQKVKKPLSVFLVLAMLLSMMAFPADAASGYEMSVLSVQKLTGDTFDEENDPLVESGDRVEKDDVIVLTIGCRNTSGSTVVLNGFAATLKFDDDQVAPQGLFGRTSNQVYQINTELTGDYTWSNNGGTGDDYIKVASTGLQPDGSADYEFKTGETLSLVRMAFKVTAENAYANFTFDTEGGNTDLFTGATSLPLDGLQPRRVQIGEGGDDSDETDDPELNHDYLLYVSKAQKLTGTTYDETNDPETSSAKKNEIVVLTISAENKLDKSKILNGFAATLKFDDSKVAPQGLFGRTSNQVYQINTELTGDYTWSNNGGTGDDYIKVASTGLQPDGSADYELKAGETLVLVRMAFKVVAEDGVATFPFDKEGGNTDLFSGSTSLDIGTPEYTLLIGDPVPTTVSVTPSAAEDVTVPASGDPVTRTFTVEVKDQIGNVMSNPDVKWSMTPDDVDGVTMADGVVSVSSEASLKEDTKFTVTATAGDKNASGVVTVKGNGGSGISLDLEDEEGNPIETTIETKGEDVTFTADINGADPSDAEWSVEVENADGTRSAAPESSVTVDDQGNVTVKSGADAGKYYVVAKVGDNPPVSKAFTVAGDDTPDPVTSLTLTPTPSPATINVPVSGDPNSVTFAVTDNNGDDVDPTTLTWTWTYSETLAGVSVTNGVVTVDKASYVGGEHKITVTASLPDDDTVKGSAEVTITQETTVAPVLSDVTLSSNTSVADGTNANPATVTANAVGTPAGTLENISWTVTPPAGASDNGVTPDSKTGQSVTLTVSPNADEGTYTITATQSSGEGSPVVKTATLTVSRRTTAGMIVKADRASIEIPGIKDANRTATFTATDSEGNVIKSSSLQWSVDDWTNTSGIQFLPNDDGSYTLTVTPDATADIQDTDHTSGVTGKTFNVTATYNGNSASAPIVVRRADPVLSIVTLAFNDLSASTGDNPLSVVLDGSNATETVTATAKDQYGEPFKPVSGAANNISWALSSGGNGLGQNISGNGVGFRDPSSGESKLALQTGNTASVLISRSAQHGTYIVEAAYDVDGTPRGAKASMTITRSEAEQAATLTLSGGLLEMTVPGKGEDDNVLTSDSAFVAEVKNQYNLPMPDAPVTWKITDSSGAEHPGVIDIPNNDGIVRVAYAAKDVIAANTRPVFTVTATSGNATQSRNIYIVRSAPYLDDILIEGQNAYTKNIEGTENTSTVACMALDQYETEFTGSVVWYLSPTGSGVSINSTSGLITIEKSAIPGAYNVAAAQGDNPSVGPKTLTVTRGTPVPTRVEISGGQPTIWIPGDGQDPSTTTFRATVLDQFGSEMSGQTVTWTIADDTGASVPGITIENGVVSVANEVKTLVPSSNYADFKTMRIRAECPAGNPAPYAEARIIVGRDFPELSKVQLNGMDSPDSSGQQVTFEYADGQRLNIAATALDQYGSAFPRNPSWEIISYTDKIGVAIDANGLITISSGAVSGEYTVRATDTRTNRTCSAPFLIKKTANAATALSKVEVSPSTVTLSNNAQISMATAYDGNNNPITSGLIWSVDPSGDGVTINNPAAGERQAPIQISPSAKAQTYLIIATPDPNIGTITGNREFARLVVEPASAATSELDHIALTEYEVTVNGEDIAKLRAYAYDKSNHDVTGVTWTIPNTDGTVGIDGNGDITVSKNATPGDYTVQATKNGTTLKATLKVINNTAATIADIVLTPATVSVDGFDSESATARAVDSKGATMSGVTWTVTPDDKGVSINANGQITVAGNAMTGDYTVTASDSTGKTSKVLTVTSQPSADETLTGVSLDPASVTVDGSAVRTVTATAQGTASDGITWSIRSSSGGGGVSLNSTTGKTVQITVAANAVIGSYDIIATHGADTQSTTLRVTASTPPPSVLTGVTVTPSTVTVNGTAAQTAAATTIPAGVGNVSWSVAPLGNGVAINALTGVVTVAATAKSGAYTVAAKQGDETRSATLTVSNVVSSATVTLDSVTLAPESVTLSGEAVTATATANGSNNAPITTGVTWTVTPTGGGVSVNASGAVTVSATAVSGEYTVSARYLTNTRSATLTVISDAEITYEDKDVDQTAVSGTPLATLSYANTGVKSAEGRTSMKSAALAKQNVQQAVSQQTSDTDTEIVVGMDIKLQSYDASAGSMRLDVTPVYEVVRTASDGTKTTVSSGTLDELSEAVTVSLNVPADFDAVFARHTHNSVTYYEPITYVGSGASRVASWSQRYFSPVELTKDAVTVKFNSNGGSAVSDVHIPKGGTLSAIPTPTRTGYRFVNWTLNNAAVTTATVFNEDATLTANWASSSSGGGGGGGGGSSGGGSSSGGSSSSGASYTIKLSSGTGGSLSASSTKATAETVVTVTPTPNSGYELDNLTVKTTSTKKDVATKAQNGTYTFEMPKASVTVTATFKRATQTSVNTDNGNSGNSSTSGNNSGNSGNNTPSYGTVSFVDVPPDNFFYTAVQWAVERGITNGTTATTFSPNQACTRAQMVMFLWRSQGMPMPYSYNSPFTDVDPSANYYTAMMWAVERGITNGTTATTFDPYAPCTRAQMVMFLNRVAGRPRPTKWDCPFTDITVGENYYEPMLWALEKGITNGTTATTFSPYQACTRAQMVMFLYRYLGGN